MISVIIPTYNRAHLIGETLDSILAQTFQNWECIIVDDYSTDNTDEVISNYMRVDKRFSYYKKPNHLLKGPSASRNFGLTKAKGDYINWFDSDDLMHPEKMETDLKMINSGNYDFTISQSKFFTGDGAEPMKEFWNDKLWSEEPINDFILKNIGWGVNSPLWKKKSINNKKLFFDNELVTADDFFYHINALWHLLKPKVYCKSVVFLREHNQRLNQFKVKSPFKLKVFSILLKNANELKLNDHTVGYLSKAYVAQFSKLLRAKELKKAKFYKKEAKSLLSEKHQSEINNLYYKGIFYKLFNKGYKYLKYDE